MHVGLHSDYVELDDLKRHLRIPGNYQGTLNTEEDTTDDIPLSMAITSASRAIDLATNRQFGISGAPIAMYYTAEWNQRLNGYTVAIDDVMTVSGFVINADYNNNGVYDEEITDYRLYPWNAQAHGKPWTTVTFSGSVPYGNGAIEVTAQYGWTEVPDTIKNATLIQAARFFKRRDAAFGVAGSPDLGNELRLLDRVDPDVAVMVSPYKRWFGAA